MAKLKLLLASACGATLLMTAAGATAASNVALTSDGASFVSASSFLDFQGMYGITVDPGGQTTAQDNLLTTTPTPYTSNNETRYIFGANDSNETVIIDLGSEKSLVSLGATWFDAAYQDRAPSSVSVSFSNDGSTFGTPVSGGSLPYGGSSDFIALAAPVTAQYVEYSFGGSGGVAIAEVFANAVPEPETWALMLLGVGAIGATLRSGRKTAIA